MSSGKNTSEPPEKNTLSKRTAFLLDDLIRVPGTERRIGLDPIIGLIPGVGDFLTSSAGLILIFAGIKRGVKKSVYLRMLSNWALNALIGAIPFAGDLFSFWFKSNHRNQALLRAHIEENIDGKEEARSWWPFLLLLALVIFVIFAIAGLIWLTARLISG